jgi:hypothetical protein
MRENNVLGHQQYKSAGQANRPVYAQCAAIAVTATKIQLLDDVKAA